MSDAMQRETARKGFYEIARAGKPARLHASGLACVTVKIFSLFPRMSVGSFF
jgi:hypothetical protein